MISLIIKQQKEFTKRLFLENTFDSFEVIQCIFRTHVTYRIDGQTLKDYYGTGDETAGIPDYISWEKIRPICFSMIKGNRLPLSFHISLKANEAMMKEVSESFDLNTLGSVPDGLVWNVFYKDGLMRITTSVSYSQFSPDKSAENIWDKYFIALMDFHEIDYSMEL